MSKLKLIIIAAVVAVGLLAWQLGSPSRSAPNVSFTSLQEKNVIEKNARKMLIFKTFPIIVFF